LVFLVSPNAFQYSGYGLCLEGLDLEDLGMQGARLVICYRYKLLPNFSHQPVCSAAVQQTPQASCLFPACHFALRTLRIPDTVRLRSSVSHRN